MKTMNDVQKTENKKTLTAVSKAFAVVASLVLLSLTSNANGFWKQVMVNNSFGKMAVMMDDHFVGNDTLPLLAQDSEKPAAGALRSEEQTTNSEAPLKIGNRMIGENLFELPNCFAEADAERALILEYWMTGERFFATPDQTDPDPILKLEKWMINDENWLNK